MTAEEIFNMFFGGGMPGSSVYVRRGGRWHRQAGNMQEQQVTMVVVVVMVAMVVVVVMVAMVTTAMYGCGRGRQDFNED